jgi:hypothetical protein
LGGLVALLSQSRRLCRLSHLAGLHRKRDLLAERFGEGDFAFREGLVRPPEKQHSAFSNFPDHKRHVEFQVHAIVAAEGVEFLHRAALLVIDQHGASSLSHWCAKMSVRHLKTFHQNADNIHAFNFQGEYLLSLQNFISAQPVTELDGASRRVNVEQGLVRAIRSSCDAQRSRHKMMKVGEGRQYIRGGLHRFIGFSQLSCALFGPFFGDSSFARFIRQPADFHRQSELLCQSFG